MFFPGIFLVMPLASGMLVKDWGTGSQMKRLVYSTRDLFEESFNFLTAGQRGVYPIADLKKNYTQVWHGVTADVLFVAYNGWLENLSLNKSCLLDHGKLRRLVTSNAERSLALKDHAGTEHQHEMIICDSCISLTIKRVHYAYEAVFYNYETSGTILNNEVNAVLSFQLSISSGHNTTIGKDYCQTELQPLLLVPLPSNISAPLNQFNLEMSNVGIFNFLAENIDVWMQEHFNAIVFKSIQKKLDVSLRKMLNIQNPCERFLVA